MQSRHTFKVFTSLDGRCNGGEPTDRENTMIRSAIVRIALALLSFGALQSAAPLEIFEGTSEAIETHLSLVEMPVNEADAVRFNCPGCRGVSKRVTPGTRYFLDHTEVALGDFRAAVADLRATHQGAETTLVGIFYDVKSDLITLIRVLPPKN